MATRPKAVIESHNGEEFSPITIAKNVLTDDGQNLHDILSDRKEDMMTPTIENSSSMFKVGQGDNVDYSSNVVNGAYESMVLKGKTMVNCIQEPSSKDVVLPYEFAEGQYVTINDTKESGALGVELKGQTLVNLIKSVAEPCGNFRDDIIIDGLDKSPSSDTYRIRYGVADHYNLTAGKTYLLQFHLKHETGGNRINMYTISPDWQETYYSMPKPSIGIVRYKFTATQDIKKIGLYVGQDIDHQATFSEMMVFEYQEGMEEWDIPYFEGMASCKMPILKSVGSLFDAQKIIPNNTFTYSHSTNIGRFEFTNRGDVVVNTNIQLPAGTYDISFLIRGVCDNGRVAITFAKDGQVWHNCSRVEINYGEFGSTTFKEVKSQRTFDAPVTVTLAGHAWAGGATGSGWCEFKDIRFTPVGKSSILSLPEEVVLKDINGIKDTLNCNTGEYVKRIEERVFNGSENWTQNGQHGDGSFRHICNTYTDAKTSSNNVLCDKMSFVSINSNTGEGMVSDIHITYTTTTGKVQIATTKTLAELKTWLSQNPITVQYQLETPIVTKISLPSTLKSWNTTTHIYSEIPENTLYPILSHSNPTYPVILKPSTKYSIVANSYSNSHTNSAINFNLGGATASTTVGNRATTITTPSTLSNELLTMSGRGNKLNNVMVIEGDVVGDEPYFEGICDCKSPILSNVGKNLFPSLLEYDALEMKTEGSSYELTDTKITWNSSNNYSPSVGYYFNLKPNTEYVISYEQGGNPEVMMFNRHSVKYDAQCVIQTSSLSSENGRVGLAFISPSDGKFSIRLAPIRNNSGAWIANVCLTEAKSLLPMLYEPYKSNILSCNGDKIELTEDMFEQGHCGYNPSVIGSTYDEFKSVATPSFQATRVRSKSLVKVKPNTTYFIKADSTKYNFGMQGFDNNKLSIGYDTYWQTDHVFTTPANMCYASLHIRKNNDGNLTPANVDYNCIQLSEVDKTIVLRSLPNGVCDILNVETGEYVRRIGEVVFDGSSDEVMWFNTGWTNGECVACYWNVNAMGLPNKKPNVSNMVCDSFPTATSSIVNTGGNVTREGIWGEAGSSVMYISIKKTKLTEFNVTGFRQWASQNPITVQYELETPIVSTVDIQGFPYAYTNGHVILSSGSIEQSLTPKVEYSVVTNRNGQIRSNQKMVERHQKQLDRLQAIILTNLVNTQYEQALTNLKYDLKNVREEVK